MNYTFLSAHIKDILCKFVFGVLIILSFHISRAHAEPVLTPYTYYEDFEDGAVGPWASYPPSQDTAYDPSIVVKPLLNEKNVKNRALYREITPNYEIEYEFGARKLLDMYVDDASILTFRSYIKSYRGTKGVRVRLGFEDSTMVELLVPFTETLSWNDCSIQFSDILPANETKKITAAAFMAVCPDADPETILRFGLDDVKLTGKRELHWTFKEPQVHRLEEWPDFIAGTHYCEGESLTITGTPPCETNSVTLRISRALTGEDAKTFTMKRSGGLWSCTLPLDSSTDGLSPGFWRAVLFPTDQKAESFSTSLVFLVKRKDAPDDHPKLYFSSGDIQGIMAKTSSGHAQRVWKEIQKRARNARSNSTIDDFSYKFDAFNEVHWLPVFGDFGRELRTPQQYIRDNAVVYGLSGDRTAGDAAKKALLKVAEWPAYVPPHILNQGKHSYYITGLFLTDMALGYDLVYDSLAPAERKTIAEALYTKGVQAVFNEYVRDNWVSSNTSNWICDVTAGSILCSVALFNDYRAEDLEPYLTGSILKLGEIAKDPFDENGAYGEGSLYYLHTLHGLTKSMAVLDRMFDVRFPEKIAQSHQFMLYQMDPVTKHIYTFGDGYENLMMFRNDSYLGMGNTVYLLNKFRDPYLKWLYDLNPGMTERDLIFADETIASKKPVGLPKVKLFKDIGTTVFRSGLGHEDFVFIFRCGAFVNHQHFDQGAFYFCDRGENFLGEMGRTGYYADLWYQKLVTQPGGHNCILVDGNPESQRSGDFLHDVPAWKNYASTTDFLYFDGGAFVSGRLDPIYKNKLEYLRRNILYLEPRTVLLIDEATGKTPSQTIDLRFHAPMMEDISVDGDKAFITRPSGTLTILTIAPENYRAEIMRRPMTLREISDKNPENMKARGFLQLTSDLDDSRQGTTFINVLSTDNGVMSTLNGKTYADHAVISVNGGDYFINTSRNSLFSQGSVTTDALVYSERGDGFVALRVTVVKIDGRNMVNSDNPVSLEFIPGAVTKINYSASETTRLKLMLDSEPERVSLNGERITAWSYNKKDELDIVIPAGEGEILLR